MTKMTLWALLLPALKFALPLPRLVRFLASRRARPQRSTARESRVSELARLVYRSRLGDNCLERSLVTFRYLGRLGADPRLVVAMGKEREDMIGHVWVVVDGEPVHDSADYLAQFVPVVSFDAAGRRTT